MRENEKLRVMTRFLAYITGWAVLSLSIRTEKKTKTGFKNRKNQFGAY